MKFNWHKIKNPLFLISFAIVLMWILDNIMVVGQVISRFFSIISPFIIGFAIAFILNGPMKFIEKKLFGSKGILKNAKQSLKAPISYLLTLLLFLATIFIILFIIVPDFVETMDDLVDRIPSYVEDLGVFVEKNITNNPQVINWIDEVNVERIQENLVSILKTSGLGWVENTFDIASSIINFIITIGIAFVFSVYLLLQKKQLMTQGKKIVAAYLPKKTSDRMFYIGNLTNNTFTSFLSGQLLESIIIGILFFVSMTIFKFPYAIMISTLIGTTSLIPIFGAFIGSAIGALLILVVDAKMAFWFLVMFIIIQQIEGNLIYPYVAGKAAGLPSIWILVAVTLGGKLIGILGILLFIPLFSVAHTLISESINERLKLKALEKD